MNNNTDHPSFGPGSIALIAPPYSDDSHERESAELMFQLTEATWWHNRHGAIFVPNLPAATPALEAKLGIEVPADAGSMAMIMPSTWAAQWETDFTLAQMILADSEMRGWFLAVAADAEAFYNGFKGDEQ